MTTRGEASYKVKRAILILKQFTIGQIADMTGLNHESVETIVHRLKDEGILVATEDVIRTASKRGRPRQLYALVDAPTEIEKLRVSVEAFEVGESLSRIAQRKPDNVHYLQAVAKLDAMETGAEPSPEALGEVERQLAFADRYESMLEDGLELVAGYFDFQQARLAFQKGDVAKGKKLLAQARSVFQEHGIHEQVRFVDEYALATTVKEQMVVAMPGPLRAPAIASEQLQLGLQSLSQSSVSPMLAGVILQVARSTSAALEENAKLAQENTQLQEQVESLKRENARLALMSQNILALNKLSQPMQRQPIPSYPTLGFQHPILKESSDQLIMKDVMGQALSQDYWPEAAAQRRVHTTKSRKH